MRVLTQGYNAFEVMFKARIRARSIFVRPPFFDAIFLVLFNRVAVLRVERNNNFVGRTIISVSD